VLVGEGIVHSDEDQIGGCEDQARSFGVGGHDRSLGLYTMVSIPAKRPVVVFVP
jgi:hypothetical protein